MDFPVYRKMYQCDMLKAEVRPVWLPVPTLASIILSSNVPDVLDPMGHGCTGSG